MVLEKVDKAIDDVSAKCYQYMKTEEAKKGILNPDDHTPIMDVPFTCKKSFSKEILKRIELYIKTHLKTGNVLEIFNDINDENVAFYKKVSRDITKMEAHWTDGIKTVELISRRAPDLPVFLDISLSIFAVVLTFIATVVALVLSPIIVPILYLFYSAEKKKAMKREFIDDVYNKCMSSIQSQIRNHLHASCGKTLKITWKKIFCESLSNEIERFKKMIQNLRHSRDEILSNMKPFKDLAKQVERMHMSASDLWKQYYAVDTI